MINTKDFVLLAGDPQAWDQEVQDRLAEGDSLIEIQRDQYRRGRLIAVLVQAQDGWMVRGGSSHQVRVGEDFITPPNGRYTREKAIELGVAWAEKDPSNREFFSRR
jgi:hypothetical protein